MTAPFWFQCSALLTIARGVLAAIFLGSALGKMQHKAHFRSAVEEYNLLPKHFVRPFAYWLPRVELAVGLMLLLGWRTQPVAIGSGMLLITFIAAMGINLLRGRHDLDCGCRGTRHRQKIGAGALTRNFFLLLISLQVALWGGGLVAVDNLPDQAQRWLFDTLLIQTALPLTLIWVGVWTARQLWIQLVRLMSLTAVSICGTMESEE